MQKVVLEGSVGFWMCRDCWPDAYIGVYMSSVYAVLIHV